jgi:hypothetical protein
MGEELTDRRLDPRAGRRLVEREQPVLGERQRKRGRERLRDRRDPKSGLGRDPLFASELADAVGGEHGFAVVQKADCNPGHAPALPRLRGPFRQLLRRNPLHQRAATLLRDRGLGRARSLARRAETAETHI